MHTTTVTMKDGSKIKGVIWKWRPILGYFDLAGVAGQEENVRLRFDDVQSAVTEGERISMGKIGDCDEMARAREYLKNAKEFGWTEKED